MGKRESDGAVLKRPASQVSSNDGPLLSAAAVAELEATRNINDFRKRARELGLVTQHRNPDGGWRHRSRADILEACRPVLKKRPASYVSSNDGPVLSQQSRHPGSLQANAPGVAVRWRTAETTYIAGVFQ